MTNILLAILWFFVSLFIIGVLYIIFQFISTAVAGSATALGIWIGRKITKPDPYSGVIFVSVGLFSMIATRLCLGIWAFAAVFAFMFEAQIWADVVVQYAGIAWLICTIAASASGFVAGLMRGEKIFEAK